MRNSRIVSHFHCNFVLAVAHINIVPGLREQNWFEFMFPVRDRAPHKRVTLENIAPLLPRHHAGGRSSRSSSSRSDECSRKDKLGRSKEGAESDRPTVVAVDRADGEVQVSTVTTRRRTRTRRRGLSTKSINWSSRSFLGHVAKDSGKG